MKPYLEKLDLSAGAEGLAEADCADWQAEAAPRLCEREPCPRSKLPRVRPTNALRSASTPDARKINSARQLGGLGNLARDARAARRCARRSKKRAQHLLQAALRWFGLVI